MSKAVKIVLLRSGYCLYPLAAAIGYQSGVALFPVAFCFQTLLSMANFRFFEKKCFLLLFDALLVGDVILSHYIQTYLYTTRVSNDPMSYAIGMWGAEAGVVYVFLLSLVFLSCVGKSPAQILKTGVKIFNFSIDTGVNLCYNTTVNRSRTLRSHLAAARVRLINSHKACVVLRSRFSAHFYFLPIIGGASYSKGTVD